MLVRIPQTWAAWRQAGRLAYWACLLACLLPLAAGCSGKKRSAEHFEVTGQVTYKGKPLPGGQITFVREDGFNGTGIIDENGNYSIQAPEGPVKITVNNSMVGQATAKTDIAKAKSKGAGRPASAGGVEPAPIKGQYVRLPAKYTNPEQSGLTYTVTKGKQTHNIELKD